MRPSFKGLLGATIVASLLACPVHAALQAITGTISTAFLETPTASPGGTELIAFTISPAPAKTGCSVNNGTFAFSQSSLSDATTHRDLIAWILSAKATGATVVILYDDAGQYCDPSGYPVPVGVTIS